jgi:hypothetical protein
VIELAEITAADAQSHSDVHLGSPGVEIARQAGELHVRVAGEVGTKERPG